MQFGTGSLNKAKSEGSPNPHPYVCKPIIRVANRMTKKGQLLTDFFFAAPGILGLVVLSCIDTTIHQDVAKLTSTFTIHLSMESYITVK